MLERLQAIFRDVMDDESLVLTEHTANGDIEAWDSLATVSLIGAVCGEFGIQVGVDEIERFTSVQSILRLIEAKQG